VVCFTENRQLPCTLLAVWDEPHKDPWLLVTDLAEAEAAWYRMRSWIECGFKDLKRGGWQWQQTRMEDPERASRKWLIFAVASIWVISVGQESIEEESSDELALSRFRRGGIVVLALALRGDSLPWGHFSLLSWPVLPSEASISGSSKSRQNTSP
jgi:hypothetical protein